MLKLIEMKENDVDKIFSNIWLGNFRTALSEKFIRDNNIKYIINATIEIPNLFNNIEYYNFSYRDFNVCGKNDMNDYFNETSEFIKKALEKNENILIHCKKGHNRSATIIMAFMIKYLKCTPLESKLHIQKFRKTALLKETCMTQAIINFYKSLNQIS